MSVNREELKELIDFIQEEDAVQVYDFIGYLNMKREKETIEQMNLDHLSEDKGIIYQLITPLGIKFTQQLYLYPNSKRVARVTVTFKEDYKALNMRFMHGNVDS